MIREVKPPGLAKWLFDRIAWSEEKRTISADMEEFFSELIEENGRLKATFWYWGQILGSIPVLVKNLVYWRIVMFKNYLKIAFRNIKRYKFYSLINIMGLAVGMTCFILVLLYVQYEFSFDTFHEKADRMYRIISKRPESVQTGIDYSAETPNPLASALVKDYPEISSATRILKPSRFEYSSTLIICKDKNLYENGIYADEQFFDVFTFPLLRGEEKTALKEPFSIVITEEMVDKYFGNEDPMGKTLNVNGNYDMRITGIAQKPPENSHIQFNFIISFITLKNYPYIDQIIEDWDTRWVYTYFVLQKEFSYKELEKKFSSLSEKYPNDTKNTLYSLQPLKSIHLHSDLQSELSQNGDIKTIYLFTAIGTIIFLIACINYINLSTARASKRTKEIGVRKVAGAQRLHLVKQFIGESVFLSVIAMSVAVLLAYTTLPVLNHFVNRTIEINYFSNEFYIFSLLGLIIFVGIISGSYPALFLSAFQSVTVFKNPGVSRTGNSLLRNILVVTQFTISIIFITSTIIIYNQLYYINNTKTGYNRDQIIVVNLKDEAKKNFEAIKTEMLRNPNISGVCGSNQLPTGIDWMFETRVKSETGENIETKMRHVYIDYDFLNVFEIGIVQGRNFSRDFTTDAQSGVLLNETAVKQSGWKDPIGKKITGPYIGESTVIGVVKDFHFQSFHVNIEPLILKLLPERSSYLSARIITKNIQGTLAFLETTYKKFDFTHPFDYFFLDESFELIYKREQKLGSLFGYFSSLAIFIACLGLFGLVSFTVERRTKEMGIRKVLGASVSNIVTDISKEFINLVVISNIIALPIAYFIMNKWLQNFAYRIHIGFWTFAVSVLLALFVAVLTVSYQSIKAATANPVDSLRYE